MKGWLQPAGMLLLAQMLLVGLFLQRTGRLQPQLVPDSQHYLDFPWTPPSAVLSHFRTPGYPVFLAMAAPGGNIAFVPAAHYLAYCLAVIIFSQGLGRLGIAPWPRLWTASALLYANILHGYVATIASDTLAAALVVASVGLTFASLSSHWRLLPLGLCTAAAWLVRPACLALVVQLPLLGATIVMSRGSGEGGSRRGMRTGAVLAATMLVPLLAWCTLRSAVVGRFGVVAFGGVNLIGIAGQFLDESLVDALPPDLRPVAQSALARREAADEADPRLMSDAPILNYQRIENRYDHTMWNLFRPAAEQVEPADEPAVNARLRRLALEIIRQQPTMYAVYLAKAFRRAVFKIVGDAALNPYCLGLGLMIVGLAVLRIVRPQPPPADALAASSSAPGRPGIRSVMVLTFVSHAACQMAVVILVCPPLGRMTDAMALFVPPLLMAVLIERRWLISSRTWQAN